MTLPAGSTPSGGNPVPGIEIWKVPLEIADVVAYLRPQLPIGRSYDGLPWCAEDVTPKMELTSWFWGTPQDFLGFNVGRNYLKIGVRGPGGEVTITRRPDPFGCG